jgi:arylsulfatase A-like enzyme
MGRKPNLLLIAIDSLRGDHTSLKGYPRLTTPHLDRFAKGGTSFDSLLSPSVPTTPAYASMLTGMDCFGTDVVALRHKGPLGDHVRSLPEILAEAGYNTTCVGFSGNPSARGFQTYLDYASWGSGDEGPLRKAELLNQVTLPEMKRLADAKEPFLLFLRHMDPHSPYLPPAPYDRLFYGGDEKDSAKNSLQPVYDFAPFADYFKSWFPEDCTDADFIINLYDGAVAYMDACIAVLLEALNGLGLAEDTVVVVTADHGETLYDHDCFFDHHSVHDCVLDVPLVVRWPGHVPEGLRVPQICQTKDLTPTMLDLLGVDPKIRFDGRSLVPWMTGGDRPVEPEMYLTEATWMRKHGWRTPEWKLIHALEPDFHFKPEVELYNLVSDPEENVNIAEKEPKVVAWLEARMQTHINKREKETGRTNPVMTNLDWHGKGTGPFKSSQEAYDTLHIGSAKEARKLQARDGEEK